MKNLQKLLLLLVLAAIANAEISNESVKKKKIVYYNKAYNKKCDMANEAT